MPPSVFFPFLFLMGEKLLALWLVVCPVNKCAPCSVVSVRDVVCCASLGAWWGAGVTAEI